MAESLVDIGNNTFRLNLGEDRDTVYLGDRSTSALWQPRVELTRWREEECLSLTLDGFAGGAPSLADNRLSLRHGAQEIKLYAPTRNNLEWEIVLYAQPLVSKWTFLLSGHQDLDFLFQPELSGIELGNIRPANVVGSYAVYHKTKSNHIAGQTNYRCGKAFHLYRPLATDSSPVPRKAWGEWTLSGDRLTASFDPLWLATAVYPVVIDPDLGYEDVGASQWTNQTYNWWIINYGGTTAGSDGTADSIHFAPAEAQKFKVAVYEGVTDTDNRLSNSYEDTSVTADQFNVVDISGESMGVSNGVDYHAAFCGDDVGSFCGARYDGGSSADSLYKTDQTYADQMTDPLGGDENNGTARISIFMRYSEAGGGNLLMLSGVKNANKHTRRQGHKQCV